MEKEAQAKTLGLEKGELILWSGKPEPFKILDKYYKPIFIRNYIITFIIVVSIFIAALIRNTNGGGANLTAVGVICLVPLVALPVSLSPFRNFGKNCKYFLTNKNIIIYLSASQMLKYPLSKIDKLDSVQQFDGTRSIRIGKAVGMPIRKNRSYALGCINESTSENENKSCLLYNLSEKDANTVLELINKYRTVA